MYIQNPNLASTFNFCSSNNEEATPVQLHPGNYLLVPAYLGVPDQHNVVTPRERLCFAFLMMRVRRVSLESQDSSLHSPVSSPITNSILRNPQCNADYACRDLLNCIIVYNRRQRTDETFLVGGSGLFRAPPWSPEPRSVRVSA